MFWFTKTDFKMNANVSNVQVSDPSEEILLRLFLLTQKQITFLNFHRATVKLLCVELSSGHAKVVSDCLGKVGLSGLS